jgi:hypothetical protein
MQGGATAPLTLNAPILINDVGAILLHLSILRETATAASMLSTTIN